MAGMSTLLVSINILEALRSACQAPDFLRLDRNLDISLDGLTKSPK